MVRKTRDISRGSSPPRDATEHLRSSRANEARLNAAIAELDAGCGTLASMADLRDRLVDYPSTPRSLELS